MLLEVNQSTQLFIGTFAIVVIFFFLWELASLKIELSDFIFLSTVAVVPVIFGFFPSFSKKMASILGIEFPFILLFGSLILILFLLFYRLIRKIRDIEREIKSILIEQSIQTFVSKKEKEKRKIY